MRERILWVVVVIEDILIMCVNVHVCMCVCVCSAEEFETVKAQLMQLRSKSPHGPSSLFSPPRMSEADM